MINCSDNCIDFPACVLVSHARRKRYAEQLSSHNAQIESIIEHSRQKRQFYTPNTVGVSCLILSSIDSN